MKKKSGQKNIKKSNIKIDFKLLFSVIMFLFVILGSGAAFFLSQQSQDVRNQAYDPTPTPSPFFNCNGACTTNAQCANVNSNWSCVNGRCRLTANPSSTTCQAPRADYKCNSFCQTNIQCSDVNSNWSCVSGRCRLTANPSSTTCQIKTATPPPPFFLKCNGACKTNEQCANVNKTWSCINGRCRLTSDPTSITCQYK